MDALNAFQQFRKTVERFVKLPDDDWEALVPQLEEKTIRKHQSFAHEGKRSTDVAFIVQGSFRQFYTKDGEEKTTYFYFGGDLMCAYVSCITGRASILTIQALTDAVVLSFPYKALLDLYKLSHAWQTFGRLVAEYIAIGLEERMVSLLLQTPEERYRELITGGKKKIIAQIPQQYIANYLGITPVSMSRIRARVTGK